jgi:hypothetical protein
MRAAKEFQSADVGRVATLADDVGICGWSDLFLESREFVEGFVSSCELEALHFVSVLLIGKKFREDVVFGGIEEEFM